MSLDLTSNNHQINPGGLNYPESSIYGFEDYRLDVEHLMLYRNRREIPLTPKQVQTLIALIEQRGEIVSKDALMRRLWGDTVVEESNLIQNIYVLRKTLGDTRDGKPMIETLRRRGYRFNAEVADHKHRLPEVSAAIRRDVSREVTEPTGPSKPIVSDQIAMPIQISNRRAIVAVSSVVLFFALVVTALFVGRPTAMDAENKKIAILPLTPIDPENRNILYEMGIADSLINRLNPAKGLTVRSLSSVRKYNQAEHDPVAAGRELKVDYVVESNYQISNGQIKVTSQVVDIASGKVEAMFTAAADSSSLFSAQDAVANDLAKRLLARFGSEALDFGAKRGTNNEEAYGLYLLAMNSSEERGNQNVQKALEYLERAVALDPNYALAWAGLAHLHRDIVGQTDSGTKEHYEKSMEAIRKALSIDPNLSDAYSALCQNKNRYEYDFAGAETACKRALELDRGSPQAHKTYANFLYSRGRFDEAINEIKTAMDLQPVSYRNQQIYGLTLFYARRFGEAEAQFKRLLELNPNHSDYIYGTLVTILEQEGKESEAFEYLMKRLSIKGTDNSTIERFKTAFARSGWKGVTMERIKTPDAVTIPGSFQTACLYATIGNKDKAFEYLEKAYQERSYLIAVLRVTPQLDPLRDDPRYADLLRRIEGASSL